MHYTQAHHAPKHGFDMDTHLAVLREHGRYFFARVAKDHRGKGSLTWRVTPADATRLTKEEAEEIASRFPGRVASIDADVCDDFYAKGSTDDN